MVGILLIMVPSVLALTTFVLSEVADEVTVHSHQSEA